MATVKPVPVFRRGSLVRWTSQGRGVVKHHVGIVVLRVPACTPIGVLLPRLKGAFSLRAMRPEGFRTEASYLVAQVQQGRRGRCPLHWPHASLLKPYDAAGAP